MRFLGTWFVFCLNAATAAEGPPSDAGGVEAITRPSESVVLSFAVPGTVAEVLVRAGDVVKAGQVLVRLDDRAEQKRLEQEAAKAASDVRVRAAEAQLEQSKVDYEALAALAKENSASKQEVDHAKLDVTIAEGRDRFTTWPGFGRLRRLAAFSSVGDSFL